MIAGINSWAQKIIIVVVISTIIEMILPNGKNKKYIKTVMGIYIIFVIIQPIILGITGNNVNLNTVVEATYKSANIENGKDKRTSIIIKNLPNDIFKEELKNIIQPLGNINFIYIPLLIKNKNKQKNILPCAYVNVINYKSILKIIETFEQMKKVCLSQNEKDFSKVEIFYSGTQGKSALINRFRLEKKYLPPNQTISFS